MKIYNESIHMKTARNRPVSFSWNHKGYGVEEILDYWTVQSRWWSKEEKRLYLRVKTDRGVMDLYHKGGQWWLARIFD